MAAAPAWAQTSRISVEDLRLIEQSGGPWIQKMKVVLLDGPPATADVTVDFTLESGLATAPADFAPQTGTLTFKKGVDDTQFVDVRIEGDTQDEWSITLQQDEMFFLQLSKPSPNAVLFKGRGTVTLIDDDHRTPGVQYLSAVTDSVGSGLTDGRNQLQWRVPASLEGTLQDIEVCWNVGPTCVFPLNPAEAQKCSSVAPKAPGDKQLFIHTGLDLPQGYCYSVFALYPAVSPEVAQVRTRTFDSTTSPVAWAFTPGSYSGARPLTVVPPTVGLDGVFSVGLDGVVFSMERGTGGGLWPKDFYPLALGKPAHNRTPVVPLPEGSRYFVGTESGEVHCVDARTGTLAWSRASLFPPGSDELMPGLSTGEQAPPAVLLKAFGGSNDLLLVGTATAVGDTQFFALDTATGKTLDSFGPADAPPGKIDNVFGMAVLDYGGNQVYFGTNGASFTLWGLDMGPSGTPDLKLAGLPWNPQPLGGAGGTIGAPVMSNGRLYLGTDAGAASTVFSLRISDGFLYKLVHGDGQAKGFVWPDRRDDRVYFTTNNLVWGAKDDGTALNPLWSPINLSSPSIPLQWPGTDFLYVGDGNGRLVEIDVKAGVIVKPLLLETDGVQIGAPSLDNPNRLVHVGSENGVIYAVRIPF